MHSVQIRSVYVFATGSVVVVNNNFIKFKIFKFNKKDLLALNKNNVRRFNYKESKHFLNYLNKYFK